MTAARIAPQSAEPVALRPASIVMSPARAGAAVPNAMGFSRAAMRELVRGRWRIEKLKFELDSEGRGEVLYRLLGGGWVFHFFLVSTKLPEELKTDRNFAQSWDAMGVLCQGEWTAAREAYLRREVPKQRAGYADYDTLIYARGNRRSGFAHQPDAYNSCMTPPASPARRKVMEWIVLVAAIVLGVPAAAWFAQDRLIFFPQPLASTAHLPADAKPLEIVASDGTRLRGWIRTATATPAPVVLYFGGNAEEVSWTLADPRWPREWRSSPSTIAVMARARERPARRSSLPTRWPSTTRLPHDPTSIPGGSSRSGAVSAPAWR